MHRGQEVPAVSHDVLVCDALLEMTGKKLGMTAVIDADWKVAGVFTDGDLRRMLEKNLDVHNTAITEVMTSPCATISEDILAAEAMQIMQQKKINALLVEDGRQKLVGALNMHDLLRAGIV